jgi:esterase/lipase
MNNTSPVSVLLLHGAIGSKQQLEPLAALLKDNFEVHTLNFSGHGGIDFSTQFNIHHFAKEVLAYLKQFPEKKFHVFGYSMGGYVALYLEKIQPGTFQSIYTLATKFNWDAATAEKESKMLNPDLIEMKLPAFAKELAERHGVNNWKILLKKTAVMMLEMGEKTPLSNDDFKNIHTPVMLTLGDMDKMVSKEETVAVKNKLPKGFFKSYLNWPHPIEKIDIATLAADINYFIG